MKTRTSIGINRRNVHRNAHARTIGLVWLLLLLAAGFVPSTVAAQSATPRAIARVELETAQRVMVGQPVTIRVEVLVPTWFSGAPAWPDIKLPDALTIFRLTGGYNFTDRINGQSWAGQARFYIVYPQRPRRYEIEEIPINVRYMLDANAVSDIVSPAPIQFEAVLPPEARGLSYFIATTSLELTQTLDIEPDTLQVGDAFQRTISVTVQNTMGMVVPPLETDSIAGLAVYRSPAVVEENVAERGDAIIGRRVESITYVAEAEGDYTLPPVELTWWDLNAERLRRETLPPIEFTVVAAPAAAAALPLPPDEIVGGIKAETKRSRVSVVALLKRWGPIVIVLGLLVWLFLRFGRRLGTWFRERITALRRTRAESEASYFRRFRRAARSGDPRATWQELTRWLDRIHAGPSAASVRTFVQQAGNPELANQIDALDRHLFGSVTERGQISWSGIALSRLIARANKKRQQRIAEPTWPGHELNPRPADRQNRL